MSINDNDINDILNEFSSRSNDKSKDEDVDDNDLDIILGDGKKPDNNSYDNEINDEGDHSENISEKIKSDIDNSEEETHTDSEIADSTDSDKNIIDIKKSETIDDKAKKPKKKKKKRKSRVNSSIFVALIVVCIVLTISFVIAVFGINLGMEYLGIGKKDVEITLNIPSGSNSNDIAKILKENGIIENETLFKLTLKLKNDGGNLKPGDITLKPVMGYDAIIEALCETRESYDQVTITFPEGISLYEVAQLLQENGVCSSEEFIYEFNTDKFGYEYEDAITTSAKKFYKFEGFFFPDTYSFYVEDSAYNVTKNMRAHFEKVMQDNNLYNKIEQTGMTIEEVITLASVVQAEAANSEDMKNVASVFINRLNNPNEFPKLQSDATDNYFTNVIAPQNGDSTSLAMFEDAYNTYVCDGLPAGAIGNPGLDAILAVVDAPKTNYFYFCSDLETKECFFAETLEEHTENLKKAGLSDE